MPCQNIEYTNNELSSKITSAFWKGDFKRFGTNDSIEGKFLLPNYNIKKTWLPTSLQIESQDFEAIIENNKKKYILEFKNETIKKFYSKE